MRTAPESRKVAAIIKSVRDGSLIPRPEFQRRSVWTNRDKIEFIRTILESFPFPEIYVAVGEINTKTGEAKELLVDGQQRVTTITEYFLEKPPFSRAGTLPRYAQLEEAQKTDFLNYDVSVRNLGIVPIETIRAVFQRMNATSYDLNDMERINAVYLGEFKKFAEEMTKKEIFLRHGVFSSADIRRMKDISFTASLTVTMMSDYFNRDDEVETFLEQYNEDFPRKDELAARFDATIAAVEGMNLPEASRAWKKADFYTLFVEVDRLLFKQGRNLDLHATSAEMQAFYTEVEAMRIAAPETAPDSTVGRYVRGLLQSTNDRGPRVVRGASVAEVLGRHVV
ncbi:MAG: DUF262 domain-containing protein [Rhodobacteraceae bacterium]|nr:DUF262 domain-containing protein [Paracoccaceae bacterium]MCF8516574.1 DUF262 domain-containing protein [Paracoccaceae bacterium]MCF8520951.1 DUF262 domain-containing protein [Paracoccaceae bacterium]